MKLFVTGVAGQLGHDVMNELHKRGYEGIGSDLAPVYNGIQDGTAVTSMPYVSVDITDAAAVEKAITEAGVDLVVHSKKKKTVDAAEDEDKQELVRRVNALGTENIAKVCKKLGIKMMYLSTDYVFDGQGETPWEPDCKDYKPLNVYGQTKLDGELAVYNNVEKFFIIRIAWVFGKNGKNFIKTILKEAHYVFVAAPTRPLTKKPVVTLAEIAENDVIITNQQFYFSDMSNEYTKNTLAYLIKPRFDLWNPIAAMELAKLDCGIALLASYLVEDAVKKGELCTLNVPELDFTVWLQVLRHEQKAVTPQMSAFYKLLREYYKK